MTKVYLLVGSAIGDSPSYYVVESQEADKVFGDPTASNSGWWDIYAAMSEYFDSFGDDAYEETFRPCNSAVDAVTYCKENDLEIEEEVDFQIY